MNGLGIIGLEQQHEIPLQNLHSTFMERRSSYGGASVIRHLSGEEEMFRSVLFPGCHNISQR